MARMSWFAENYASKLSKDKIKILDVGSYEVNGSYKHLFPADKFEYTGLDMVAGPNVDITPKNTYEWNEIETDTYDIVISGQVFEHAEFFWITMAEMTRVLKKDGLMCIIVPNGFPEHRHPVDCYRFFSDGMIALARYVSLEPLHAHTNCAPATNNENWYSITNADTVLVAKKPYEGPTQHVDLKSYTCVPPDQEKYRGGLVPHKRKFLTKLLLMVLRVIDKDYK